MVNLTNTVEIYGTSNEKFLNLDKVSKNIPGYIHVLIYYMYLC